MKLDTITVIKPTIKPTISIIPRSKPKISAAASGFGVGGTTQCAVVAPIVRHPVTYPILRSILEAIVIPIGIRIINVTSKNTGMDKINPAILKPQIAFFAGNADTILSAITSAAPLSFISCPRIVPKPTGKPILVIIFPNPDAIVDVVVSKSSPPITPITKQAITIPIAAFNFNTIIQNRMTAIATTRAKINNPGDVILFSFLSSL